LIKYYSQGIWDCSTEFDIDQTFAVVSELDILVKRKFIKKNLETDSLYVIEGKLLDNHSNFINEEKFEQEMKNNQLYT